MDKEILNSPVFGPMDKNITAQVHFGDIDGEMLSLRECICGHTYDSWDFVLHADKNDEAQCIGCRRKMYFKNTITVFEVVD